MKETVVNVYVDGVRHTLRPSQLGPLDALACREQVGMSLRKIMQHAQDDPDIDGLAAIVWLARRQAGERKLLFADVATAISYDSQIDDGSDDTPGDELVDDSLELADPELSATA